MLHQTAARFALVALSAFAAGTAFAQGGTIRIEPRPFYGATVTIEEGVRVFRPLPPDRYVIINPGNQTPVNLNISDSKVYENSTVNHNYKEPRAPAVRDRAGAYYGGLPIYPNKHFHGGHKRPKVSGF